MAATRNLLIGMAVMGAAAAVAGQAAAQVSGQTHCGVTGHTVVPTVAYDPFNPNAVSNQSVTLTLDRFTGSQNGQKTSQSNFYFTQPAGGPAVQLLYQGAGVLYTEATPGGLGQGAPALSTSGSGATGTVGVVWNNDDQRTLQFVVSLPAGMDVSNGVTLTYNIVYSCNGTGSGFANATNQVLSQAITLPVQVLSAVQASYAGPAMAFGDVGGANASTFAGYKAPITGPGYINVKSSGPYKVDLSSQNGYRMLWGAGSPGAADQIKYSLHFLGRDLTDANAAFATINCTRAGVTTNQQLPMRATLAEAGAQKTPATTYQDTLTVTITPVDTASDPQNCAAL